MRQSERDKCLLGMINATGAFMGAWHSDARGVLNMKGMHKIGVI